MKDSDTNMSRSRFWCVFGVILSQYSVRTRSMDMAETAHGGFTKAKPTLTQSASLRPHNKSEEVEGLFFVGAGTHPGAGLPGVISSAKVLERFL